MARGLFGLWRLEGGESGLLRVLPWKLHGHHSFERVVGGVLGLPAQAIRRLRFEFGRGFLLAAQDGDRGLGSLCGDVFYRFKAHFHASSSWDIIKHARL